MKRELKNVDQMYEKLSNDPKKVTMTIEIQQIVEELGKRSKTLTSKLDRHEKIVKRHTLILKGRCWLCWETAVK